MRLVFRSVCGLAPGKGAAGGARSIRANGIPLIIIRIHCGYLSDQRITDDDTGHGGLWRDLPTLQDRIVHRRIEVGLQLRDISGKLSDYWLGAYWFNAGFNAVVMNVFSAAPRKPLKARR